MERTFKIHWKKIAKNIGLLYKAKPFLDKDSPLSLCFSYIHSYINYVNLAWASTRKTNLKKIHSQQKHALRTRNMPYNRDRYYHTRELFSSFNVSNVYKLNLLNTSIFMHKKKNRTGPAAFHTTFKMSSHSYSIRFLRVNYSKTKTRLCKSRSRISIPGPWNIFVANTEKELESRSLFKSKAKTKLLDF